MGKVLKGVFCYLSLAIALAMPVSAQWYEEPFPTSESLFKVAFFDTTTGWIVGSEGLYRTVTGGLAWNLRDPLGSSLVLCVVDSSTVFHVPGMIRRTTDVGATFATVDSGGHYYSDMQFVTSQIGYAAGAVSPAFPRYGMMLKTTDGGSSWFTVSTITEPSEFRGLSFVSEEEGWAITYYGTIYHTIDGGVSWEVQDSTLTSRAMRDIQFTSPDSGWAIGGLSGVSRILQTTDGGVTWEAYDTQSLIGSSLREIGMVDSRTGFIVGIAYGPPTIVGTLNGGQTWNANLEYPERRGGFESISMVDAQHGWAVGSGAVSYLYRTNNGGATWVPPGGERPVRFMLAQNYPNPFNPQTTIRFEIGDVGYVKLEIFDPLGRKVAIIVDEELAPGSYARSWDATGVASGVYYYRMLAGGVVETKRLVLLK